MAKRSGKKESRNLFHLGTFTLTNKKLNANMEKNANTDKYRDRKTKEYPKIAS
jgi:hypothetical protein